MKRILFLSLAVAGLLNAADVVAGQEQASVKTAGVEVTTDGKKADVKVADANVSKKADAKVDEAAKKVEKKVKK